jgi:hypothetical protein
VSTVRLLACSRAEAFLQETGYISQAVLQLCKGHNLVIGINDLERLIGTDPQFALRVF